MGQQKSPCRAGFRDILLDARDIFVIKEKALCMRPARMTQSHRPGLPPPGFSFGKIPADVDKKGSLTITQIHFTSVDVVEEIFVSAPHFQINGRLQLVTDIAAWIRLKGSHQARIDDMQFPGIVRLLSQGLLLLGQKEHEERVLQIAQILE